MLQEAITAKDDLSPRTRRLFLCWLMTCTMAWYMMMIGSVTNIPKRDTY